MAARRSGAPEFLEAANDPAWLVCAHNAQFELAIEQLIMRRRHGWPKIPLRQQRCTMAAALALALPPKLELVAEALELLHQKDRAGQRLMVMMSKPRRPRKDEDPDGCYWFDDEGRCQRLYEYCRRTWRSSASCTSSCGRCRPRSSSCGYWTCALMPAASTSIAILPQLLVR